MQRKTDVVIVGASVRAAAFSALRAGLRPWCVDLFADADLSRECPTMLISGRDYPAGFLRLMQNAPAAPLIYVGALENRPRLVSQLAQARPLWGNEASVLRKVRRPWEVAEYLEKLGLPCPAVERTRPSDGCWLVKPIASAGGHGIRFLAQTDNRKPHRGSYLQEYIEGLPCSALYVADHGRNRLLGVNRQLVGESWLHARPFQYCGSVGPLPLQKDLESVFVELGQALVEGFNLRGLFGVDYVLRDCVPYPVEVNPRYTASVEVWEHATGQSAIELHARAFNSRLDAATLDESTAPSQRGAVGKAILFARNDLVVPKDGPWQKSFDQPVGELREFADIPHQGCSIRKGSPIVSVFARAKSAETCIGALKQCVANLDRWLFDR